MRYLVRVQVQGTAQGEASDSSGCLPNRESENLLILQHSQFWENKLLDKAL